jgi:hypothetical protein
MLRCILKQTAVNFTLSAVKSCSDFMRHDRRATLVELNCASTQSVTDCGRTEAPQHQTGLFIVAATVFSSLRDELPEFRPRENDRQPFRKPRR